MMHELLVVVEASLQMLLLFLFVVKFLSSSHIFSAALEAFYLGTLWQGVHVSTLLHF